MNNIFNELEESSKNLALLKDLNSRNIDNNNFVNTIQYIEYMKEKMPGFSPLVFYEQSVIEGHPTHPNAKTRLGFSTDDLHQYSPESRKLFPIKICIIKKEYFREYSLKSESMIQFILSLEKKMSQEFMLELNSLHVTLDDYRILLVHPWQWENIVIKYYSHFIESNILIGLNTSILSTPLISLRSLALFNIKLEQLLFHVKMALSVLTTGDMRVLTGRAVESGVEISGIIQNIQAIKNFHILKETQGAYVLDPDEKQIYPNRMSDRLSFLFRENAECFLESNEIAVPCAALIEKSPFSEKKICQDFIEEYSKNQNLDLKIGALSFFKEFVSISLPGLFIYLTKYGLSLEGHAQNTIIAFIKGVPTNFFVRDLSDIRISKQRLALQGLVCDVSYINSAIFCTEKSKLQKNVFYSYIQGNVAELILQISYIYNIDETILWKIVRLKAEETFNALELEPELFEAVQEDRQILLNEKEIAFKAVLKMRIKNEISNYEYEYVKNPLFSDAVL